jgi:hypothetical protein
VKETGRQTRLAFEKPPPEFFLSEIPQYRRSLIRNTIAVTPFRGVGFGAMWEAPP